MRRRGVSGGRGTTRRMNEGARSFRATADQADRRLDRVLRGLHKDIPLGAIMKAVRAGAVRVNGRRASGDVRLSEGDEILVPWAPEKAKTPKTAQPNSLPELSTLFRNEFLWCVDKPAGLLSQPDRAGGDSVVTRAWEMLSWDRNDFRPAVIGRLDRNVSGVTAIALTHPSLRALSEHMREGTIKKIYRAVVSGNPPDAGEIDMTLVKDAARNTVRRARAGEAGMEALTRFRCLEGNGQYSLLEVELVTGRPHQARAHLAFSGYPIAGDRKYCAGQIAPALPRPLLHAYSLHFPTDPAMPGISGITAVSPMPECFHSILSIVL